MSKTKQVENKLKNKLKTSLCCTFIHSPFQLSPAPQALQLELQPNKKHYSGGRAVMVPEQPRELHTGGLWWQITYHGIRSSTGSRDLGTISSLHVIANLNKPVIGGFFSTWSNEMLSIFCEILGINKHPCYPEDDLGLPVLTWNSTGHSICPFSLQHSEKLLFLNARKKGGTAFQKKKTLCTKKNIRQRRNTCRGLLFSFLPTRAEFIWLCFALMNHTDILLLMHWLRPAEPDWAFLRHFILQTATAFLFKIPAFKSLCLEKDQRLHISLYPGGCKRVVYSSQ